MKKFITTILSVCLLQVFVYAQEKASITGDVLDNNGKGIANATISVLKAADSSLVKADISDKQGHFEVPFSKPGQFLIAFTRVGYEKKYSPVFEVVAGSSKAIGSVTLAQASGKLSEVTVVATKKPLIEVKADKTVFNVENSINATGSNAMELLQKSPGISVDNNDNISMKGKTGVKIYIDGKPTQLDATNLAAYLRSINSNDIEAIEMISNPSAKYDASGNAGIVNIKLKKNKRFGMNGNASVGFVQGVTPKGNGSVSLNYRNKKVNLFGNVGGDLGRYENTINLYRVQNDTLYDQRGTNWHNNNSVNFKGGADYFLSSKHTIGVLATLNFGNSDGTSNSNTPIYYNPTSTYIKTLNAGNTTPSNRTNNNFNVNYRYTDTSGTEVNFDGDYGYFKGRGNSNQPNNYSGVGFTPYTITYQNNTPTDIDIYTAKVDVEKKAFKGKLGFGGKFSYVTTKNTFDFYNASSGVAVKVLDKSNFFKYTENVNAAYINFQRQLSTKVGLQVGLRMEATHRIGDLTRADGLKQADAYVDTTYYDWFPSAAITWNVNKKNTLNLTYSRRIDRPSYQDLNPFENKLDELTYQKGNAFLRPQYTDNLELTHTFMGFINTTLGYSYVHDYATQVTDTTKNATYVQQQNLATQQILSASLGAPLPIRKWWMGYLNLWYNYQIFNGTIGGKNLTVSYPSYGGYMQHTFTIGKGYSAELSGWFNGPSFWGATWRTKAQGSLDFGIQKSILDKKGTIKISATDLLATASPWRATNDFGGLYVKGNGSWESRTFRVTFSYRFGSSQVKEARDRKTGLESEKSRIK